MKAECKNCGGLHTVGANTKYGYCRKPACNQARTEFIKSGKPATPSDAISDDFWELNDIQKEHYSTFLSLIRIPKTLAKGRRCVGCRTPMTKQTKDSNNYICTICTDKVNRQGALASVSF